MMPTPAGKTAHKTHERKHAAVAPHKAATITAVTTTTTQAADLPHSAPAAVKKTARNSYKKGELHKEQLVLSELKHMAKNEQAAIDKEEDTRAMELQEISRAKHRVKALQASKDALERAQAVTNAKVRAATLSPFFFSSLARSLSLPLSVCLSLSVSH